MKAVTVTETGYKLYPKIIKLYNIKALIDATTIIYYTGKDMAKRYDLHHWDRSWLFTFLTMILNVIQNDVFVFYNEDNVMVSTTQTRKAGETLLTFRMGVKQSEKGNKIGACCVAYSEEVGKQQGCIKSHGIVYAKAKHSLAFHEARGCRFYYDVEHPRKKYELVRIERDL